MIYGIGLGSNLGDRLGHIQAGIGFLRTLLSGLKVSSLYETSPIDCPEGSGYFYNAAVEGRFDGEPAELLKLLKEFELTRGERADGVKNAPRALDLDLLYTEKPVRVPGLVLPHPRLGHRRFVLEPLSEIRPDLVLNGEPIVEMMKRLSWVDQVKKLGSLQALKGA